MRKILDYDALFFSSDGTRSTLLLQEENPFAVLVHAAVHISLVLCKILIVEEIDVVAQLAYNRPTHNRFRCKGPQSIAVDCLSRNMATSILSLRTLSFVSSVAMAMALAMALAMTVAKAMAMAAASAVAIAMAFASAMALYVFSFADNFCVCARSVLAD